MKQNTSSFISNSEEETAAIGSQIAGTIKPGEKIFLTGNLGAGKTVFVRGFVRPFGISAREVMSPTFTLVRQYGDDPVIYHVDLYRLDKEEDIFEAGIYDLITGDDIVLIEWADRLQKYRPAAFVEIQIEPLGQNVRRITVVR